jgi:hypothetical protein
MARTGTNAGAEGSQRFRRWSAVAFLIGLAVSSLFFAYQRYGLWTFEAGDAPDLAIPLRFTVLSRSDTSISGKFRFYNAEGREIASFERSWNGSELFIESLAIPLGERVFVFPCRVFTDAPTSKKGTSLFPYYDQDGFPAIFDSQAMSPPARQAVSTLFFRTRLSDALFGRNYAARIIPAMDSPVFSPYGRIQRRVHRSRELQTGVVYALRAYSDGTTEVEGE